MKSKEHLITDNILRLLRCEKFGLSAERLLSSSTGKPDFWRKHKSVCASCSWKSLLSRCPNGWVKVRSWQLVSGLWTQDLCKVQHTLDYWIIVFSSATQLILHRSWRALGKAFLWSMHKLKSIGSLEPAGFFLLIGASMSKYEMITKKTSGQLDKDQDDQHFDCCQGQELV